MALPTPAVLAKMVLLEDGPAGAQDEFPWLVACGTAREVRRAKTEARQFVSRVAVDRSSLVE